MISSPNVLSDIQPKCDEKINYNWRTQGTEAKINEIQSDSGYLNTHLVA